MKELQKVLVLLFAFIGYSVYGQQDSLLKYESDTVTFYSFPVADDFSNRDTITLKNNSVFGLESSAVQLQTNGPGSLMTPLIHGLGARHTAVLWNGLNIQSPVNGTIDLNLVSGFDKVIVSPSSVSSFVGTAGLSGSLQLLTLEIDGTNIDLDFTNTNNQSFRFGQKWIGKRHISKIGVDYLHHNNNYHYYNQNVKVQQEFAAFKGYNLRAGNKYYINETFKISTDIWWQDFERQVAPSKTARYNEAKQFDKNFRGSFKLQTDKSQINIGFLSEGIKYQDVAVFSQARVHSIILNLAHDLEWMKLLLSFKRDAVEANFFADDQLRKTLAIQFQRTFMWKENFDINLVLRNERYDDFQSPVLFLFSWRYQNYRGFTSKLTCDRSYNIPTFNDLYWPTGGNPNLDPEKAFGINAETTYHNDKYSLKATAYYKRVHDWIVWAPGPVFWSPSNQRNVSAKGLDIYASFNSRISSVNFSISPHVHLNSTRIMKDDAFSSFVGNQLIYVPTIRWGTTLEMYHGRWNTSLVQTTFGDRFTGFDNIEKVGGFNKFDLAINYTFSSDYTFSLNIENFFNEDYERVAFYPMPLRNFSLSIKSKI